MKLDLNGTNNGELTHYEIRLTDCDVSFDENQPK